MSENQIDTLPQDDISRASSSNPSNWSSLLQGNAKFVIGGGILLLLAFFAFKWYSGYKQENENEAGLALSRIRGYFDSGEYQIALNGDPNKKIRGNSIIGLKAIVEEYGSTSAGKSAALYAGNAFVILKKMEDAEKYFEIASNAESNIVVLGAKAGLASCLEAKQKYLEAAEMYEQLLKQAELVGGKDRIELYAGLCYEKLGQKEKSEKMFRDLLAEFESSEFSGEAKSGLVRLGMIVE